MRRYADILLTAVAVVAAATGARSTAADPSRSIRVNTSYGADSVTVGERLRVRFTAVYPDSLEFIPPGRFDTGTCRVLSVAWDEQEESGGRRRRTAELELMTLDLEAATMPPVPFRFRSPGGDTVTVYTDEVSVPVRSLASGGELRPLKPQWEAPRSYRFLLLIPALLAVAVLARWLWRRRAKTVVPEAPQPEFPADYIAFKELTEIERMKLPEQGEYKQYYTLVVDTIRRYIERRFGVDAMDRTTYEILTDLAGRSITIGGLEKLLRDADLVKFAKLAPDVAACADSMAAARDIVASTALKPAIAAGGAE